MLQADSTSVEGSSSGVDPRVLSRGASPSVAERPSKRSVVPEPVDADSLKNSQPQISNGSGVRLPYIAPQGNEKRNLAPLSPACQDESARPLITLKNQLVVWSLILFPLLFGGFVVEPVGLSMRFAPLFRLTNNRLQ